MSKHLRNQRRLMTTNTQMTQEQSKSTANPHEAFTAADELVHDDMSLKDDDGRLLNSATSENKGDEDSLAVNDPVPAEDTLFAGEKAAAEDDQGENMQNNAPSMPFIADEHPNGDDPDRVPVIPELADDQVPNMPGAILKHAREMLGLSLRDVSTHLKLRVNTVSDIEHDRLTQPTAANFVIQHITAYAKLVNIDPSALVDLYRQNVREVVQEAGKRAAVIQRAERKSRRSGFKIVALSVGALALLVLGIGIGSYLGASSQDEADPDGALILSPGAQVQQELSGAGEDMLPPKTEEKTEDLLDPNTKMARDQAASLGTDDIIGYAQKSISEEGKPAQNAPAEGPAAALKTDPALNIKSAAAPVSLPAEGTYGSEKERSREKLTDEAAAKPAASDQALMLKGGEAAKNSGLPVAKPVERAQDKAPKADAAAKKAADTKVSSTEAKDEKIATLPSQLRDLSSSVRIVNRKDIGSLNTVSIQVKDAVALRILGSSGKILKNGPFKKGQAVSATGMPPLRIEGSDRSRITVKYNGGTASVPAGRNVSFELPVR